MQLASISSIAPVGSLAAPLAVTPVAKPSKAASETAAAPAPIASKPAVSAHPASHGGGSADSAGTASTSEQLVAEYATTVNGKSYGGSVEQSGSEYTATASGLAGASASGSSITAAENNLGALIDILA